MYAYNQSVHIADSRKSEELSAWINGDHSLTDKLKTRTGSIELEVVSQRWTNSGWWDSNYLNINNTRIFRREIIMRSHGIAYWYARTIIPQKCYDLDPVFFNRLQQESIRNLIFGTNQVHRIQLKSYPVNYQCLEFYWVKKYINTIKGPLWIRFAEFSLRHLESFYLIEILLPELENLP